MQSLVLFLKKKNKWNLCRPPLKGYLWPNMSMTYHRISCSKNTRTPLSYRSISKPLRLIFWPCYKLLIPNIHQLITISFHIAVSCICNRHIKIICHAGVKWIAFQKSKMPDTVCTVFTVCKLFMYYVIISIFPFGCKRG